MASSPREELPCVTTRRVRGDHVLSQRAVSGERVGGTSLESSLSSSAPHAGGTSRVSAHSRLLSTLWIKQEQQKPQNYWPTSQDTGPRLPFSTELALEL